MKTELTARVVQRHSELQRMHDLKQKLIAAINTADPPLRKSDLGIKGVGGNVTKADEDGVTTTLLDGKTETISWSEHRGHGPCTSFLPPSSSTASWRRPGPTTGWRRAWWRWSRAVARRPNGAWIRLAASA